MGLDGREPWKRLISGCSHLLVFSVESQDAITNRCDSILSREGVLVVTAIGITNTKKVEWLRFEVL